MSEVGTRPSARTPLFTERERVADERPGGGLAGYGLTVVVGAAVFLVALDRGGYADTSRTALAVGIWWAIVLAVALGLRPLVSVPRAGYGLGGLLLAFAVWTFVSTQWAASAERAFSEGDRVALYLGVFALVVLASWRGSAAAWADGLALGIAATALLALFGRLFPAVLDTQQAETILTGAYARLSYPLGYWNGLAIFTALAVPLLLRAAVASRFALVRGASLMVVPALLGVIYLTASRGGFATAIFGSFCFVLLAGRRWTAVAAAALAAVGSVGVIAVLEARDSLVNDPGTRVAESQGRSAALLIAVVCILVGLVWAAGTVLLRDRLPDSGVLEGAAVACVVIVAVVAVIASDPISRFESFKANPETTSAGSSVSNHLLNTSGTGRWQLWSAALDSFDTHPWRGRGAGSYEAWWLRSPHFAGFARDAHSLYAETLGELGIVGLLLLGTTFLVGVGTGLRRTLGAPSRAHQTTGAALVAAFLAFGIGAAVDWMWELTVVGMVAFVLLALMTGPATLWRRSRDGGHARGRRVSVALATVVAVIGLVAVGLEGIVLVQTVKLGDSQAAVARRDFAAAVEDARDARSVEPWASSPYAQLALVSEQLGRLRPARIWIARAIDRDREDWRLWLVQARIQTKLGQIPAARRSLERARSLYPDSPLLAPSQPGG